MINFHEQLVSALQSINIPVYYELILHSGLSTPCISYIETNNYQSEQGETLGYSRITYQVKVWSKDISEIQRYALEVDNALRVIGFKRISSTELTDGTMIQKIMSYEGLALEEYE